MGWLCEVMSSLVGRDAVSCARSRVHARPAHRSSPRALLAVVALAAGCSAPGRAPPQTAASPALTEPATTRAPSWTLDRSTFDPTASPCDDFYQYVCGGWERAPVLADRTEASWEHDALVARAQRVLDQLLAGADPPPNPEVARLRTFYTACMVDDAARDRADEPVLRDYLARIAAIATPADVQAVLRELQRIGVDVWLSYVARRDVQDRDRYRAHVMPGKLGLRTRDYLERSPPAAARRDAYRALIARMFELVGIAPPRARSEAAAVVDLEIALATASPTPAEEFDLRATEHPTAPGALHALAPHVDWTAYLALVGHADRMLNVPWPRYLQVLDQVLADRPLDHLRAALRWRLLDSLADDLPAPLAEERARFYAVRGARRPPRPARCQLATLKALGVELSRQFAVRALGPDARATATRVIDGLRAPIAERVAAATWLSPQARAATVERIRKVELKVGYPDRWPVTGDFALHADMHLANVLAARRFEQARSWQRARAAFRRADWEAEVRPSAAWGMAAARLTIPNAFPDAFSNSLVMTAAKLEPPLFDPAAPLDVQYGRLGAITGHELVHLIDAYQFDAEGAAREVWTPADIAAYDARRRCLIEQAEQFVIGASHVNGAATLEENTADLSGVAFAYAALSSALGDQRDRPGGDGMAPAQRFFVAYAQTWCTAQTPESLAETLRSDGHAPPRFRVNGPLADLPEFAAAFSCPAGSRMVRPAAERCQIW